MTFIIEWHPKARKFLQKLPKGIAARIVLKLRGVQEDPFHYLEHYEGKDYYKLRIGDYRLLIDIDFKNKILKIQVIDHRGRIYERQ